MFQVRWGRGSAKLSYLWSSAHWASQALYLIWAVHEDPCRWGPWHQEAKNEAPESHTVTTPPLRSG